MFLAGTVLQFWQAYLREVGPVSVHPRDKFDPSLIRLNSLEKLVSFTDSLAAIKEVDPEGFPEEYAELADSVVRSRFYYGLQNYRFSENYLANLAGKYIWSHFKAKVKPDHILRGQKAFCSQSSIVFQALLLNKGIDVRTVLFHDHFCTEVLINGHWSFHDVSYKPNLNEIPRLSTEQLIANPHYLQTAYLYSFREDFARNLEFHFDPEKISYGKVNAFPAPSMILFHQFTWFFSWFGWAVFLGLALVSWWVAKKSGNKAN